MRNLYSILVLAGWPYTQTHMVAEGGTDLFEPRPNELSKRAALLPSSSTGTVNNGNPANDSIHCDDSSKVRDALHRSHTLSNQLSASSAAHSSLNLQKSSAITNFNDTSTSTHDNLDIHCDTISTNNYVGCIVPTSSSRSAMPTSPVLTSARSGNTDGLHMTHNILL